MRPGEAGILQHRIAEVRLARIGVAERGAAEVGAFEVHLFQHGFGEIRGAPDDIRQVGAAQVGAFELGAGEAGAGEIDAGEIEAPAVGVPPGGIRAGRWTGGRRDRVAPAFEAREIARLQSLGERLLAGGQAHDQVRRRRSGIIGAGLKVRHHVSSWWRRCRRFNTRRAGLVRFTVAGRAVVERAGLRRYRALRRETLYCPEIASSA